MKFFRGLCLLLLLAPAAMATAAEGMIELKSPYSVTETVKRLDAAIKLRGLDTIARVDHASAATKVGMVLRPTTLLIFGNAQGGTPFMKCTQSVGIDLPLKALVWEDASAQIWLGYNDPAYLAKRHDAGTCPAVEKLREALAEIAKEVVAGKR